MTVGPADLSTEQLNAYIKAKLVISGIDLSLFPTTPDAVSGAPTQDQVLAALRSFIVSNPGVVNRWRPPAPDDMLSQMLLPPLEYPSITEAWAR